jgi:hypothetical protein
LSNLTDAERINTREEVARWARVGTGTVTNVQWILNASMAPRVIDALRSGEISIHFALKLRKLSHSDQVDAVKARNIKRATKQKLVRLAKGCRLMGSSTSESLRTIGIGLKRLPAIAATKPVLEAIHACLSFLNENTEILKEGLNAR